VLDENRQEVTMELHVLAATDDGTLWHNFRNAAGKWALFCKVVGETPSGVNPGKVVDSASAVDSNKNLHVLVVTPDGTLCHALRSGAGPSPTGLWTNLVDVATVVPKPPESPHGIGRIRAVTAATDGLNLQVLAATEDGKLWQTVRKGKPHPDLSSEWSRWNRYRTDQQPDPQFLDRCRNVEPGKFRTLTTARVP
jgi:hypothetical protein